jgi:prolipoprotein diacylglyceryltransferase
VPLSYFFTHSGKSIIGGIVGGYLAIVIAKRAFRYTRSTGDCYAAAIPIAMAIGRVGCFLSELPLGKPTDLPWGIAASQEAAGHFEVCPYCTGNMHPTMVYEIIFHLLAFALILRFRHLVIVQGDTLKIYLLAAAIFRFLVEYLRTSPEMVGGLTGAQVALIPLSVPLVVHFVRQWRRKAYRMPPVPGARRVAATSWEAVPHPMEEERVPV